MDDSKRLFATLPARPRAALPEEAVCAASRPASEEGSADRFAPFDIERLADVVARASCPDDPIQLRDLWIGRVESALGAHSHRPELAQMWRGAARHRSVGAEEIFNSRAVIRFVKELFNWYFRDDLYGSLRPEAKVILSGGAVDEEMWGLPATLKDCIRYALDRDFYGYSDSRGRDPAREAIAAYENARLPGAPYTAGNVALTMGATFGISALADFVLLGAGSAGSPALCAIPNYPPLVESVARRAPTRLVPLPSHNGECSLASLIDALRPDTPLILLQTAANPTGAVVPEPWLERLVAKASPSTIIILDECHEWLGPAPRWSRCRAAPNVVRVSSLSKTWSIPGLKIGWILADSTFIDEYYEYASTTFGGPPSFFYTLVEVLARIERWMLTGVEEVTASECAEFEDTYGLTSARLQLAYRSYREERLARNAELLTLRNAVMARLHRPGLSVHPARYSINIAAEFDGYDDSYLCFRDVLRRTGVSVFPGILTFCLSGGVVRVTSARPWEDWAEALRRLDKFEFAGAARPS